MEKTIKQKALGKGLNYGGFGLAVMGPILHFSNVLTTTAVENPEVVEVAAESGASMSTPFMIGLGLFGLKIGKDALGALPAGVQSAAKYSILLMMLYWAFGFIYGLETMAADLAAKSGDVANNHVVSDAIKTTMGYVGGGAAISGGGNLAVDYFSKSKET